MMALKNMNRPGTGTAIFYDNDQFESHLCICTKRKCGIFTLIIGSLLTLGGIIGISVAPMAARIQMDANIPLRENSFAASQWIEPPFVITMQFWFFNTSNQDAILEGKTRPAMQEKGPYTYKQKNQKRLVKYGNSDNVSYIQVNDFYFDQSRSCPKCRESDVFVVPNAVYSTISQILRFQEDDKKRIANLGLLALSERPFVTKRVDELLFNGFEDQLLTVASSISRFAPKLLQKLPLPKRFSYFPKNETDDGRYEVRVGEKDVREMGQILSWNGKKQLTWWNSTEANAIRGTDASLFPPYIKRHDRLPIFVSDLCRSTYLRYDSDVKRDGLDAYRFVLPADAFDTSNPKTGFCQPTDKFFPSQPSDGYSCLPPGLLNVSSCRQGSPMLLSMPHFLFAADEVTRSVDGMNPKPSDHQAIFDILPSVGAAINVQTKLQINVPLYPDKLLLSIKKLRPTIIPLFWFNASAYVDPGTRDYLYSNIVILQGIGYGIAFLALGIGLILMFTVFACMACNRLRRSHLKRPTRRNKNTGIYNQALIGGDENGPTTGANGGLFHLSNAR